MIMKKFGRLITGLLFVLVILTGITALEAQENSYAKGLGLFYNGNYPEALDSLNKAATAAPQDPRPCFFIGVCLSRMGQQDKAYSMYKVASAREYLPGGRQVNVDNSLRRIQGAERLAIEQARKDVAAIWAEKQKARSIKKYGNKVQKQSELLTKQDPATAPVPKVDAPKTTAPAADAKTTSNLPTVSPITPLSREEREVVETNKIYDTAVDEFQFFRDDIGKTVLSTVERKRLAEREAKVTYADPMDKPAADGSKFINIYDPLEVVTDSKPFSGEDDPDDLYAEAEQSPLVTTCHFLDALSYKSNKNAKGMNSGMDSGMSGGDMMGGGDMMMGGDDMMMGGGMSGNGSPAGPGGKTGSRKIGDDTNLLYKQNSAKNPFNSFSGSQPASSINPFKIDRDFKQSLETTNSGQPGSEEGMMLSPPM